MARPQCGDRTNAMESLLKRAFDLLVASAALVVLAPIIALVAATVRWRLGTPTLFRQHRAGLDGASFTLYKLRTMNDEHGPDGGLLPDERRMTRLGARLRASSLDELPELWNVLRGDMSLVGPRPLPTYYLDRYTPLEARRHEVRPGITGWAQVNGRNATSWDERLAMDVWYVDNRSFRLDLKILWLTVGAVLSGQGVSAVGHATMPELRPPGTTS